MRSRANPWWRTPRDLPPNGSELLVVISSRFTGEPTPVKAIVLVKDCRVHYVYEWGDKYSRRYRRGVDDAILPFDIMLEEEGVTWCRGWDTNEAKALLAAQALL